MSMEQLIETIKFNSDGLVPAITQDEKTGDVLMLAYMNKESFGKTLETGKATYWSRSRGKLWVKGETSGNTQIIKDIFIDCDGDTILLKVLQLGDNGKNECGASCHTGHRSCFYRKRKENTWEIIGTPLFDPKEVYKK